MRNLVKVRGLQFALILGAVFLLSSYSQASQNHDHSHHIQVVSPFDKVTSEKPLYCLLNAHLHRSALDCPHKVNGPKKSRPLELRADCGSHPGTSHSSGISFGSDLPQNTDNEEFLHHRVAHYAYPPILEKGHSLPRTIEHPPQLS